MNAIMGRLERTLGSNTVAWRMKALGRVVLGAFVLIFMFYGALFVVENRSDATDRQIGQFGHAVGDVQRLTLQARRNEKDFYLRRDPQYVEQHGKTMTQLFAALDRVQLHALASDQQTPVIVPQVRKSLEEYAKAFGQAAALEGTAGLNQNLGLHGEMRKTIQQLEKLVPPGLWEIEAGVLMLRRHEKDFIQRETEDYIRRHADQVIALGGLLDRTKLPAETSEALKTLLATYAGDFEKFAAATLNANKAASTAREAARNTEPLDQNLKKIADEETLVAQQQADAARTLGTSIFVVVLVLAIMFSLLMTKAISRSVLQPVAHLQTTVRRLQEGDETARSMMRQTDELGELGRAFDGMIESRIATQLAIQTENEQLNNSVLDLLQAVAVLARRDLTGKIPVTADVTGPVADALNLLANETAKVLQRVSDLSADVASSSLKVREQSETVMEMAKAEQREVETTAVSLANAADEMTRIANLARSANATAGRAIGATRQAMEIVTTTIAGINNTRDTIRETEKRIKRLGERSQEISLAVGLINSIAERTHILALNASMHAASAGEAGRGFAVVADEVQRLAENSRQATQQIASLVNNIQADTAETVSAMNSAIEQVVAGSRLAEQAGNQMRETERTTTELVTSVQEIAGSSDAQVQTNRELLVRADAIRASSQKTNEQLQEQSAHTHNLVEYSRGLLAAVRVFKLPA